MAAPTSVFHYCGYSDPQPGDTITVWRGPACVGYISWYCCGEICWTLSLGGTQLSDTSCGSVTEAKGLMEVAFEAWALSLGLTITDAVLPVPERAVIDWGKLVLGDIRSRKRSEDVINYMTSRAVQRMLDEMGSEERVRVSREAKAYARELKATEDKAAARAA